MRDIARRAAILTMLACVPSYARVGAEYMKWARGEFRMPPQLAAMRARGQLEPSLNGSNEFLRMAAVRRLAEIEGTKAALLLREVVRREQSPKGLDYVPLVKLEAVRILGAMRGPEAESALLDLFNDYWARRADLQRDAAFRCCDFCPTMCCLLDALERKAGSPAVFSTLEGPALSGDVAAGGVLSASLRQRIWEVYLRSRMMRSGTVAEVDQVESLLHQLDVVDRECPFEYLSLNHIKALAIRTALARYSDAALRTVSGRIDQALGAKSYEGDPDARQRRRELSRNKAYLQKLLRDHVHTPAREGWPAQN